jgi:hypothetical protein
MVTVKACPIMPGISMICTIWFCLNENTLLLGLRFCKDCKSHEVFTAVLLDVKVSWDVTLCQVANNYPNFGAAYDLLQVQTAEELCSIELLVYEDGVITIHQMVGSYVPVEKA